MAQKNSVRTSSKVATAASKTLRKPSSSAAARTLAGSALSNRKKSSGK